MVKRGAGGGLCGSIRMEDAAGEGGVICNF